MNDPSPLPPGRWTDGPLPANVRVGADSLITGDFAFKQFYSEQDPGLVIGSGCTMEGVHFSVGKAGRVKIGDYCYFTNAVLLCELELRIGHYVMIGWNTTIADTDFHPVAPADRVADAIACSPLGKGMRRPEIARRPVWIEDGAWIGPAVTILKGVQIGQGAFIEPGAVVTGDVAPRARVLGNPARVVGEV